MELTTLSTILTILPTISYSEAYRWREWSWKQRATGKLPGKLCRAQGCGHTFFAQSWSNTCECASFPPQKPGDQCNWWSKPCGYCCQTCNASAVVCKSFDNVMMLPVLTSRYGYFGDNASAAIACLLRGQSVSGSCEPDRSIHQMGCSNIPKGKCTVRFHDTDMYIATHPADFVSLPPEAAICGDTREDGFSRPNPRPGTFSGPWWDSGVEFYRTQSAKFFPQLRAAFAAEGKGHLLDGIYQDQELDPTRQSMMKVEPLGAFMPSAGSNITLKRFCLRARWTAVQRDARFVPMLELLRRRGFMAPNATEEWLADAMMPYSEPQNWAESFEEHDLDKIIWEATMAERMSLYWREALFAEADKIFPGVRHANAGRYAWDPKHCPVNAGGTRRCRAGVGAAGYNVFNQMLYDSNAALHCGLGGPDSRIPGKNCDLACGGEPGLDLALYKLYGVPLAPNGSVAGCWKSQDIPCGGLARSGFSNLVIHSNLFKGMVLAAPPGTVVRPDVSDKSMCPKDPDFLPKTGPDDFYQERILHYAVMGADEYIYFGPWDGFVYGTRATMSDHELFSSLLKEADALIGCSGRSWISDQNLRYTDSFVLHGVRTGPANESNVWRLSPHGGTSSVVTTAHIRDGARVLNITGLQMDWCTGFIGCTAGRPHISPTTLQFEDAVVVHGPMNPPLSTAGLWLTQSSNCSWCVRAVDDAAGTVTRWPIPTQDVQHDQRRANVHVLVKTDDPDAENLSALVWPLPAMLKTVMTDSAPAILSPQFAFKSAATDEVTISALSRYGPILRNLSAPAVIPQSNVIPLTSVTANIVTRIEVFVEGCTDTTKLGLDTNYSYTLLLAAGSSTVKLRAGSRFSVAHGLESLAQLLSDSRRRGFAGFEVVDAPVYPFRALMIDCGRRFVPLGTLYELLDGMAFAKMSVLNLHASEYGFFRIEIKAFPELTRGFSGFYSQDDIAALIKFAYLRGIRVVPQIDVPGHSSGLIALKEKGVTFCLDTPTKYCSTSRCQTQLYDDPDGKTLAVVTKIYDELLELFNDDVFDIGGDETHVVGNCTLENIKDFESKIMAHIATSGKRPLGWEQIYKVTGAAQQVATSIIRVYDTGTDNGSLPLLANVTAAEKDVVVADSARYYMNSCCPATHGHKLCPLGNTSAQRQGGSNANLLDQEPCFYTDIAAFDMGKNGVLSPQQRQHVLGGSCSMWTDAYCASNECGAWSGPMPEAGWMAASPAHDAIFHDSLLASIFPAAIVAAGAFYRHHAMPMAELNTRWQAFNNAVLIARGLRSCPNECQCAEDNYCGKVYRPRDGAMGGL